MATIHGLSLWMDAGVCQKSLEADIVDNKTCTKAVS